MNEDKKPWFYVRFDKSLQRKDVSEKPCFFEGPTSILTGKDKPWVGLKNNFILMKRKLTQIQLFFQIITPKTLYKKGRNIKTFSKLAPKVCCNQSLLFFRTICSIWDNSKIIERNNIFPPSNIFFGLQFGNDKYLKTKERTYKSIFLCY